MRRQITLSRIKLLSLFCCHLYTLCNRARVQQVHQRYRSIKTRAVEIHLHVFWQLTQNPAQKSVFPLCKWHIAQRHIYFPTLVEYTPPVGKGIKAGLAVIAAHAGGPHTAERHSGVNQV